MFARLLELDLVKANDLVILTKGELSGVQGGTNSMQILKVSLRIRDGAQRSRQNKVSRTLRSRCWCWYWHCSRSCFALLRGSLPQLDGDIRVAGLAAPVTIERDRLGVPTVTAANADGSGVRDGVRARPGSLLRDGSVAPAGRGELSEIIGAAALAQDEARASSASDKLRERLSSRRRPNSALSSRRTRAA